MFLIGIFVSTGAQAKPEAPALFCDAFENSAQPKVCNSGKVDCTMCHTSGSSLNPYGNDVKYQASKLLDEAELFEKENLAKVLDALQPLDSDEDGVNNADELSAGTAPGVSQKTEQTAAKEYDMDLAYRRVMSVYRGRPPTYSEVEGLSKASNKKSHLHGELDKCLASDYWKNEALHRLADVRIQPLSTTGFGGNVVLADYRFDYRLFSYILSDDRDARELLTAKYHINEQGQKVEGRIARTEAPQVGQRIVIGGGQPLDPARRHGMMTTQWFLTNFTMFAELPRNTSAQVYRAYLGMDIAKGEGLKDVPGEPRDVDNKNVAQKECAVCHSTLDALSYSFANYNGIETVTAFLFNASGTYVNNKTAWEGDGVILGKKVPDLGAWAQEAIKSDEFKRNLATMFFEQALGRMPSTKDAKEFDPLWKSLPEDGFSANKLIHRLVDTTAFGGI